MTTRTDPGDSASGGEGDDRSGDAPAFICWVCQQPLDRETSVRFRGEPVHPDCLPG